jgi:delta8-fatty-acid desaturase
MHNLLFHNRRVDQFCGWICGNVILGISSKWWRDEHNEHHLFTNTGVEGVGPSDPQMIEDGVWMQDPMIEQFYHDIPPLARKLMARFQHLYFIPACVFVGPYTIKFLSIVFAGNRPMEHFGIALYFAYVAVLLSFFPTWKEALIFYAIGNTCLGVLSVQLLVSHYSKPWVEKDTVKESGSWAKRQIESVVDISCPPWLDWFHGGLHLHSPHHLFPRMPRCYYREVHKEVIDMCKKNKVPLEVMPWFEAIANTVRHLRQVGELINSKKVD